MMIKGLGLDESMSNLTSTLSGDTTSISSNTRNESSSTNTMLYPQASSSSFASLNQAQPPPPQQLPQTKKKRSLPGNPDPDSEVIALSPKSLLATNRFICEICNKGFQRDQNLQLHRRGHNLPWKLKQRAKDQIIKKKVYVCPEPSCVHHDPSRALGDLTGIKKHYCRKHGEKKWKCEKCSKKYAVQSDWKAHSKICGTREYRCDCGTLFSRRDSFITHRAFCDALAEESARAINPLTLPSLPQPPPRGGGSTSTTLPPYLPSHHHTILQSLPMKREQQDQHQHQHLGFGSATRPEIPPWLACPPPPPHHAGPGPPPSSSSEMGDMPPNLFSFQQYEHQHDPSPGSGLDHASDLTLPPFHGGPPPPPQMSATALLQKAAQMGVTVSNNQQQSQNNQHQHQHQMTSSHGLMTNNNSNNNNNKQEPHTHMSTNLCSSREGDHHNHNNHNQAVLTSTTGFIQGGGGGAQSSMLHDMMIMSSLQSTAGFDGPGFGGGGNGGNDGMTRDFLGLRTFSHKDFLNMAGLAGHMNSSTGSFDQQHDSHQNQTPW